MILKVNVVSSDPVKIIAQETLWRLQVLQMGVVKLVSLFMVCTLLLVFIAI